MSEENTHKNLDDFFKSRLSKQDENASWNNPSDHVFQDAMLVVNAKKKRRFGWWWFVLIGLLAISSAYLYWSQREIHQLAEQVGELNEQLIEQELNSKSEIPNSKWNETIASIEKSNSISKATRAGTSNKYSEIPIHVNSPKENDIVMEMIPETDESYESAPATEVLPEAPEPPEIPNEEVITIKDTVSKPPKTPASIDVTPINPPSAFYVFGGFNWTTLSMTAANPLPNNLTNYDNWYRGYQYGLGYEKQIKRSPVKFQSQFSYTLARNSSTFTDHPQYEQANEVNNNGDIEYQTIYGFESPIGGYSQSIAFAPEGAMNQGDAMTSTMNVNQAFRIYGMQAGLGYEHYLNRQWQLQAFGAIGINYISELSQDFDYKLEGNNKLLDEFNGSLSELTGLNKVYPSWHINTEIQRSLGPIKVGLSTGYQRSLASIRTVDSKTQVKTQMSNFNSSIKLSWNLN